MFRSSTSKIIVMLMSLMLMTAGLSGCRMNLPDTSKIGPDGAAATEAGDKADAAAAKEGEDSAEADADGGEADIFESDGEEVTDVTAGTVEDGTYYLYATIHDGITVNVDAPEVVLKDKSASKAADAKDKSGDLAKARLTYWTNYYEGDEASAKEDIAELGKGTPTDSQMAALKKVYGDLGKVFAQFDITVYDFTAPTDADADLLTYDVFSTDAQPFAMDITFDGDIISDITISYDGELE